MKTASVMLKNDKVFCVELFDTESGECNIFSCEEAQKQCCGNAVYVWGNGEHFEGAVDLKTLFYERHNFYISFRAFAPFKSFKAAVQLGELLSRLPEQKRLFWRTRAGAQKAWWDASFEKM